jgi:hypothetical protein
MRKIYEEAGDARDIYYKGLREPNFDFDKGLDELIKKDSNGYYLKQAINAWPKIDKVKASKAIENVKKNVTEMTMAFSGPPAVIGSVIRSPAELVMGKIKKKKVQKGLKRFKKEVRK